MQRIQITSQIVAQGSYGLQRINPENGVRKGNVMKVWHAQVGEKRFGPFKTREEARAAVRKERGQGKW